MNNLDEDEIITKRLLLKENNIKHLASKYINLINKFNSLTRDEMKPLLDEILYDIDMIEINTSKTKNIIKTKKVELQKIKENKINNEEIKNKINNAKIQLGKSIENKEYKFKCEALAKEINEYKSSEFLKTKISQINKENNTIISNKESIDKKINEELNKIDNILEIVEQMKKNTNIDDKQIIKEK